MLCVILFAILSGWSTKAQDIELPMVEMTRADYNKFVRDSRDLRALKVGFEFLTWENKNYRTSLDSLSRELNRLFEKFETLKVKYEASLDEIAHMKKLVIGYEETAYKMSQKALRMQRWKQKYFEVASIKIGGVIIVMVATIAVVYYSVKWLKTQGQ